MKQRNGSLHCTRCHRHVADSDADARFKHGEIIACRHCTQPTPRHRYHRNCHCPHCLRVRTVLMEEGA